MVGRRREQRAKLAERRVARGYERVQWAARKRTLDERPNVYREQGDLICFKVAIRPC